MSSLNLNKLSQILKEFRKLDKNMNINMALCLIEVAKSDGLTGRDLEARLDISAAAASRNLSQMEKILTNGKAGWDLVEAGWDQIDKRNRLRYPNQKMKSLTMKIDAILGE